MGVEAAYIRRPARLAKPAHWPCGLSGHPEWMALKGSERVGPAIDNWDLTFERIAVEIGMMARPLRIEYAGVLYHVMARGNQGRTIYADEGDRKMWLATLRETWGRTGWGIHAWALAPTLAFGSRGTDENSPHF